MAYKRYEKKIAYDAQYVKDHYDRFNLRLPKGYKNLITQAAEEQGISVNQWIKNLIDKEIGQSN